MSFPNSASQVVLTILALTAASTANAQNEAADEWPVLASKTHCYSEDDAVRLSVSHDDCVLEQFYVSAHIGQASGDFDASNVSDAAAQLGYDVFDIVVDDIRTAWKIGVGTNLSENSFIELGYVDLGEVSAAFSTTTNVPEQFFDETTSIHPTSVDGFTVSGLYQFWRHEDWFLHARIGAYIWKGDYDSFSVFDNEELDNASDLAGIDIFYGVGGNWRLHSDVVLHVEWEQYHIDGETTELISAGLSYLF